MSSNYIIIFNLNNSFGGGILNSIFKSVLFTLLILSLSATAAEHKVCDPKKYEIALKYQQKSAEIFALQLQIYRFATERFNEKIKYLNSPEKYAVIMDLDETVIDNTPLLSRDIENCHDYSRWDTWNDWEIHGHPNLIPGAKVFLQNVNNHKVRIYYVSDRSQKNKQNTMDLLKSYGLPQVSEKTVLLDTVSKEERRQAISKNHQIIMLFGDSLPDFAVQFKNNKSTEKQRKLVESSKDYFGNEWIILPNSTYGSWSNAVLNTWKAKKIK